ncbi:hypothetical protein OFAG_02323 [Oxalobacter formigenes HOxBLS]|uniref:Uncharacterized protein n=1 Tax=Oxalobacter paraformigenes TaxID=556268 RepID=T5LSR8_9BURK|nr:hypothetical protein OFAG_02323 [Oxalobacter paraformigenes]
MKRTKTAEEKIIMRQVAEMGCIVCERIGVSRNASTNPSCSCPPRVGKIEPQGDHPTVSGASHRKNGRA